MSKKSKFPSLEEVNKAPMPQIKKWYNALSSPKAEELDVMKTIIRKHMKIRRIEKEGGLV
jgi:hypothetical protein